MRKKCLSLSSILLSLEAPSKKKVLSLRSTSLSLKVPSKNKKVPKLSIKRKFPILLKIYFSRKKEFLSKLSKIQNINLRRIVRKLSKYPHYILRIYREYLNHPCKQPHPLLKAPHPPLYLASLLMNLRIIYPLISLNGSSNRRKTHQKEKGLGL